MGFDAAESSWAHLEVENQKELLAYLGRSPLVLSQSDHSFHWVMTGVRSNDYNGVLSTQLAGLLIDQTIQQLLDRFQTNQVPFMWFVNPTDNPPDLSLRLMHRGCRRLDPGRGMGIKLKSRSNEILAPAGLSIRQVSTAQDLTVWMDIWTQMQGEGQESSSLREALYTSLLFQPQARLRNYVAWMDDTPVGITQLFIGKMSAGLYSEAVLEQYQGRGIGTALVRTACREAHQAGCSMMVTGPTQESVRLYQRIGFILFENQAEIYHQWPATL